MKYLHNDRLAELTTLLTDCPVGQQRLLHGRLEVYTMKRGTVDKKYAYKLGEKYVASLEHHYLDHPPQCNNNTTGRKRSQSAGLFGDMVHHPPPEESSNKRRVRANSFDTTPARTTVENDDPVQLQDLLRFASSGSGVPSALGDFSEQGTRRLMTDLILTLNMSFPDFDFSAVKPADFTRYSVHSAVSRVNKLLSDVALRKETFLTDLWSSIDAVIHLADCDVYSYQPISADDQDDDPMAFLTETLTEDSAVGVAAAEHRSTTSDSLGSVTPTTMWTFNYFFVNKTIKRIVLFTCVESMRSQDVGNDDEEEEVFVIPVGESEVDFDMDPADARAGGIPISSV